MLNSPLHTWEPIPTTWLNRVFALFYTIAIFALFYRHFLHLFHSPTPITISLFLADLVFALLCLTTQPFHLNPIRRQVFLENLSQVAKESEYPSLDIIICTADPYKEPPIGVVNTALSVMAYDYPMDKLSVYVSDDGGSQLTLFAFLEAAKFAKDWLPYCKKYNIVDRSPEIYFGDQDHARFPETDEIKLMYESMKAKVEKVVERGSVYPDYITNEHSLNAFSRWTDGFTRRDHPTVIEVILESSVDKDVAGCAMPNLIYVAREKSKVTPHQFKAGALNALLRVSCTMTNAPIFLVLDCDMRSNDSKTPLRVLCYFLDPNVDPKLAFIQFPQRFHGITKNDIYASEFKFETQIYTLGMDGLRGAQFMGTGGFCRRSVLTGGPISDVPSEMRQVSPQHLHLKSIQSKDVLALAHHVAGFNYENNTKWGSEIGFRYGTLTEDTYTSYRLHCEGWRSIFCNPIKDAFLGVMPITFHDALSQTKRWYVGFLDISLSKYSPITFGVRSMNPLHALCYAQYTFRAFWSISIITYAFLPQLALANSVPIFPKVSDTWFFLYAFLFFGAYGKHFLDFILAGGTVQRWWNLQRIWMIWGVSNLPFALLEYSLQSLGMSTFGFSLTSKVVDHEQNKRYEQGMFEFGVASPLFYPISTAATINLLCFVRGMIQVFKNGSFEELFVQIFIAGFVVVNSWPIYEAMVLRSDEGKMPLKVTLTSVVAAWVLYLSSSVAF